MVNLCIDENPWLCPDYKPRKKLYDLLVHGGYISVIGESEQEKAHGDKLIEVAKRMIIEYNRSCVSSNCRNIENCTSAIEEESPLDLPKGFFSLKKPDSPPRTLRSSAFNMMRRAVGKA